MKNTKLKNTKLKNTVFLVMVALSINFATAPAHALGFKDVCLNFVRALSYKKAALETALGQTQPQMSLAEVRELADTVLRLQDDPNFDMGRTHIPGMVFRLTQMLDRLETRVRGMEPGQAKEQFLETVSTIQASVLEAEATQKVTYQFNLVTGDAIAKIYSEIQTGRFPEEYKRVRLIDQLREAWSYHIGPSENLSGVAFLKNSFLYKISLRLTDRTHQTLNNPFMFFDVAIEASTPIPILNILLVKRVLPNWITPDSKVADGNEMPPEKIEDHDIQHNRATRWFFSENPEAFEVIQRIYEKMQSLYGEERELAELVFFQFTHEQVEVYQSEKDLFNAIRDPNFFGRKFDPRWDKTGTIVRFRAADDLRPTLPLRLRNKSKLQIVWALNRGRSTLAKFLDQVTAPTAGHSSN